MDCHNKLPWSVLGNRNLFPHSSEDWKSEVRVPACSGSSEGSLPDLQMPLSHSVHITFLSVRMWIERQRASSLVFLLKRALIPS